MKTGFYHIPNLFTKEKNTAIYESPGKKYNDCVEILFVC